MNKSPTSDSAPVVDREPRCWRCDRKLGEALTRPWKVKCGRCKATNAAP